MMTLICYFPDEEVVYSIPDWSTRHDELEKALELGAVMYTVKEQEDKE